MIEFVLVFTGKISTTSHTKMKFEYRRQFRKQLKLLDQHLKDDEAPPEQTFRQENRRVVGPFTFLPYVTKDSRRVVDLDITFLSSCEPGCGVAYPTGDLDNFLKQLLDGLRMAQNMNEVRTEKPRDDEKPFHCLLEDDQQVRTINIQHFKHLSPMSKSPKGIRNEVKAIIKVKISEKYCY